MKRSAFWLIVLFVLALAPAATADMEAARSGYGSLIIGGVFQGGFTYYFGDDQIRKIQLADGTLTDGVVDRPSIADFWVGFARLNFKGTIIDDHVRYFAQLELNPQYYDEEATGPQLLDMKIGLKYIPYTTLWVGRYAPDFTFFNPMSVSRLGLIDYPLMNQYIGVQRQTGIEAAINHKWFDFNLGATNGLNYDNQTEILMPPDRLGRGLGNDDWGDENTMKDIYVSAAVKPVDGMRLWGGYWWGNPLDYFEEKSDGELKPHHVKSQYFNGGIAYFSPVGVIVLGEFFMSKLKYDNDAVSGDERNEDILDLRSMSYYGRLGFNMKQSIGFPLEILAQYDWIDPDTDNKSEIRARSEDDEVIHITGGLNYYIKDHHAVVGINYVYKDEDWDVLQKDGDGRQTGYDNDEFKIQVQVAF